MRNLYSGVGSVLGRDLYWARLTVEDLYWLDIYIGVRYVLGENLYWWSCTGGGIFTRGGDFY